MSHFFFSEVPQFSSFHNPAWPRLTLFGWFVVHGFSETLGSPVDSSLSRVGPPPEPEPYQV